MSFIAVPSDALDFSGGRQQLENLFDVDLDGAVLEPGIAEHDSQWLVLGQFLHEIFIDTTVSVKTGDQGIPINKENVFALKELLDDGQRQIDSPIQHHLKEQILLVSSCSDVFHQSWQPILGVLIG
ncbi:hypothetical protein [Verminephrobacter aporrectodeae]|uniref:hypothetical protein n=1 Tax=Verminephrobacter aporrectodeae TaxID=1110389 RepID=UPI0022446F91|nr:hypothetical protein [Verminephrobacter aporrectodeae]